MSNKLKLAIEIIAIVAIILIVINIIKNNTSSSEPETEVAISDIQYNETSGEYYIEDEETGEVLHTGYSEEELYIYTVDSDYEAWDPDENDSENNTEEDIE